MKARFGTLGELDFHYAPTKKAAVGCGEEAEGKAHFEGTFTFTGENEYVHIDAGSADGVYHVYAPYGCAQARHLRRVVPYSPSYSEEGATRRRRRPGRALSATASTCPPSTPARVPTGGPKERSSANSGKRAKEWSSPAG